MIHIHTSLPRRNEYQDRTYDTTLASIMAFGKIKVWNLLKTIDEESDVPVFIGLYTRETGHAGPTSAWVDQDKQGPVKKGV